MEKVNVSFIRLSSIHRLLFIDGCNRTAFKNGGWVAKGGHSQDSYGLISWVIMTIMTRGCSNPYSTEGLLLWQCGGAQEGGHFSMSE